MSNKYEQVETGIYRYKAIDGEATYHERPHLKGKRTYRSLGFGFTKQTSLKLAREEYHRRRAELVAGRNPYEEKKPEPPPVEKSSVSQIILHYRDANCPDRYLKPRTGRTLESEKANCETLLGYWNGQIWDKLTPKSWDDYHAWRVAGVKRGCTGDRSVDSEKVTLCNAFKYALRKELVTANPASAFPRYQPQSAVHHCREYQPQNADELHKIAELLFTDPRSEALGWQLLYEANTGLRTVEMLMLREDAKPGEPGYVAPEGNLHVVRVKRGINPFVHVHAGLKELMQAHAVWKAIRCPSSPWFFPGRDPSQPLEEGALAHALRRLRGKIGKKITSHGMRAYYVLVRRSQGIPDGVIAVELGQRGGAALILSTYGDIPENWRNGGGPNLKWLPEKPAWNLLRNKYAELL